MEHQAILNTHPTVAIVSDTGAKQQTLDKDNNPVEINRDLVDAEVIRLQAEYDAQAYARNRKAEYDQLNQFEMQFDDDRDGTTTWVDAINEIKDKYPKDAHPKPTA